MAEFPALPLFTDAYLADTMHLSCLESGAYLHLMIAAWRTQDCALPDDDDRLARFAKCSKREWKKIKNAVLEFWDFDEKTKKWTQKRLLRERKWVHDKRKQQSHAGKASALKRKETTSTDDPPPLQRDTQRDGNPPPTPHPYIHSEDKSSSWGSGDPDDDEKWIWSTGLDWLLSRSNDTERAVRSRLGQWLKDHDPFDVRQTIQTAQVSATGRPENYIIRVLNNRQAERRAGVPASPTTADEPGYRTTQEEFDQMVARVEARSR